MPVYEYQCKSCKRVFEYQQRMADPDKTVCEACGGELDRLISATAFQLKGGGWYKDLYSSTKPAEAAKPAESKPDPSPSPSPSASPSPSPSPSPGSSTSTGSGSGGDGGSKAAAT